MKRLLVGLVLIVAGVAGLSFYRGWIHFTSDSATDKPSVTVTVDKEKIQDDKNKAVVAAKGKATATTEKSKS